MERFPIFCYNGGHKTPWNSSRTGEAPPTRHPTAKAGQGKSIVCGALGGSIKKLCLPMVPNVSEGRFQGPPFQEDSWPSSQVILRSESEVGVGAAGGSIGCRVSDRSLDPETDCSSDPEAIWCSVSPQPCLEVAFGDEVELSEARTSGSGEERRGDRALEAVSLAAYKKKPKNLGPIWCFLMSLVSYSFRTLSGLGRRKAKPRSSITFTNRIVFRPSVVCRFPRSENGWLFISGFGLGISRGWMFDLFSRACLNT